MSTRGGLSVALAAIMWMAGATAAAQTAPAAPPSPAQRSDAGADFTAEARLLYRVAACAGTDPVPERLGPAVVAAHCKTIQAKQAEYRARYFEGGRAFFDALVPDDVPAQVVYPFGGGDLISALVAFPEAKEITTISLELAGDPRRIDTLDSRRLETSLAALRVEIGGMLAVGSNTSANLSASQRNDLPAQVSSFLIALAAGGYEPVGMRYFTLGPDGAIQYLGAGDIDTLDEAAKKKNKKKPKPGEIGKPKGAERKGDWTSPNFSEAFAHVEIRYRRVGEDQVRIHRHIAWNLGDRYLADHPELIRHLSAKGKVAMMTKGASYLLWRPDFATIRNYMLGHLAWMVSDSTGIPPAFASKAGMVQETYGRFTGAFLPGVEGSERGKRHADDFRALWARNKVRKLPFRFGYVDVAKKPHLLVTRPR
jgi:hypothetical protein